MPHPAVGPSPIGRGTALARVRQQLSPRKTKNKSVRRRRTSGTLPAENRKPNAADVLKQLKEAESLLLSEMSRLETHQNRPRERTESAAG